MIDISQKYRQQVSLLVKSLPIIAKEKIFALKGGTAINLFVQNFPRLSVDIDLAYLPLNSRSSAIQDVQASLKRIATNLEKTLFVSATLQNNKPDEMRIIVSANNTQVKIEVSPVLRGSLMAPIEMDVVEEVENEFGFASINVLSLADLYGGKICAALDRQHPRDLFDVHLLIENIGINREIFNGFITYLLSHNRPIHELLSPNWKDIQTSYSTEFEGMSFIPMSLQTLQSLPEKLISMLIGQFTERDYDFIKSFKLGNPDWSKGPDCMIEKLPAIQWKLKNIKAMPKDKHTRYMHKLENIMAKWLN